MKDAINPTNVSGNIKKGSPNRCTILPLENPLCIIKIIITINPIMKPTAACMPHVAIIVIKYLHQLFLPDSAVYKNGIYDIKIPPDFNYGNYYF